MVRDIHSSERPDAEEEEDDKGVDGSCCGWINDFDWAATASEEAQSDQHYAYCARSDVSLIVIRHDHQ